ncbi:MAG: glycosyltransferase family 1 protein, partial [Acidobacteriota bacterium]
WASVETLSPGPFDFVQATGPFMLPSRRGRRAITVHDLDFLRHPERTWGEMRRDFPALARRHAAGADMVVTTSEFSARSVERQLGVPASRITVCRPGVPDWAAAAGRQDPRPGPGYVLFVGTLEPRKNVPGLLDAYQRMVANWPDAPTLVLAGGSTPAAEPWLARIADGPLAAKVEARGYVADRDRRALYDGAAVLVLPSFDEGFGLPVLEAMAVGVPVVATTRGAIPEVAGDAALLVDPEDGDAIAHAIKRVLTEPGLASSLRAAGFTRARKFDWAASARTLLEAYRLLLASPPAAIGARQEPN